SVFYSLLCIFLFFIHPAPTEISTLSLLDALPISADFAEDDRVLLEELSERLGVGAVDADDEEARLGPAAEGIAPLAPEVRVAGGDRKSTRLNSSHQIISYAVFCLKKKNA